MTRIDAPLAVLGVSKDATLSELQSAYRDLLQVWSPERFAHDPNLRQRAVEKCAELDAAYATLVQIRANPQSAADLSEQSSLETSATVPPNITEHQPIAWRAGRAVVVKDGAVLDQVCVRCGGRAVERVRHALSYLQPGLYLLLIVGVIGWIVMAGMTRRASVVVALCEAHSARRRRVRAFAWSAFVGSIVLVVFAFLVKDEFVPYVVGAAVVLLLASAIGWVSSNFLRATDIRDGFVWFTGASPQILSLLPDLAAVPPVAPATTSGSPTVAYIAAEQRPVLPPSRALQLIIGLIYAIGVIVPISMLAAIPRGYERAGEAVGMWAFGAGLLALIIHATYPRSGAFPRRRSVPFVVVALAFVVAVTATAYSRLRDENARQELIATAERARKASDELLATTSTTTAGQQVTEESAVNIVPSTSASDDTIALNFIANEKQRQRSVLARLNAEQNALAIDRVLAPKNLVTLEGIESGRSIVEQYRRYITRHEAVMHSENKRVLASAEALNLSAPYRENFLRGLRSSLEADDLLLQRWVSIERGCTTVFGDMLDFMAARLGTVDVSDQNQLLFRADDEVRRYNTYLDRVRKLADEEDAVTKEITQRSTERRAKLEEFIKHTAR